MSWDLGMMAIRALRDPKSSPAGMSVLVVVDVDSGVLIVGLCILYI